MIKYALICDDGHEFEGWFQNADAFDIQAAGGQLCCPMCGAAGVTKAVMAPRVASSRPAHPAHRDEQQVAAFFEKFRAEVESTAEYVGSRFADEARKIHFEEVASRPIYGEATLEEARSLNEDGVPFMVMPRTSKSQN